MRLKDWRKFGIKALIVLASSLGIFLLVGGLINLLSRHFVFNRVVIPLAQMFAEDACLMGPTVEQLYHDWFLVSPFLPFAGLVCIFFGFMVAGFERDAQDKGDLTDLSPVQKYSPMPISHIIILISLTLAAVALRIPNLNQSLWVDEISAAGFIKNFRLWHYTNLADHWLYTFFGFISTRLFGENDITLRMPVFVLGVFAIPLAYFFGRDFLTRKQALLLSGIFCASGLHIFHSVEARGNMMLVFFSLLSTWLFLRLISGKFIAIAKKDTFLFGTFTVLGLLSHFYYIWVIFAQVMTLFCVFISERIFTKKENGVKSYVLNNLALSMVLGCLIALIVYGPGFFTSFILKIRMWGHLGDETSLKTLGELFTGKSSSLYGIVFTVIAIFGMLGFWKRQRYLVLYGVFLVALPLLIMKFTFAIFNRYFMYTLPILYILFVRGMIFIADRCKTRLVRNIVLFGVLAFYMIMQLPVLILHYGNRTSGNQDYRAVARFIDNFAREGDIIFAIGVGKEAAHYYFKKHKFSRLSENEIYQHLQADKTKLWTIVTYPEIILDDPRCLRIYNAVRANLKLVGYFPGKFPEPILVYH